MSHIRRTCPAKVNLSLELLARRPDGYHDLSTVLLAVGLLDSLEILPAEGGVDLAVTGADLPEGEGNLVHAAATSFLEAFAPGQGVRIHLTKRIPIRAGLGGGSSDAAGTLLALRDLLRPDLPVPDLAPLAVALGSDVPFFLGGPCALAEGRGERLTSIRPPSPRWIVLFLPPFGLSTSEVYAHAVVAAAPRNPDALLDALREDPGADLAPHLMNRLEEAAARAEPRIAETGRALRAVLEPGEAALLSGSGSAFFAPARDWDRAAALARDWSGAAPGRPLVVRSQA